MTAIPIPDAERLSSYTPALSTSAFAVGFVIYDLADVTVFIAGVELAATDYAVAGTLVDQAYSDAVVTLDTPVVGVLVEIIGKRSPRRTDQFVEGSRVPAEDLNTALNRQEIAVREAYDRLQRIEPNIDNADAMVAEVIAAAAAVETDAAEVAVLTAGVASASSLSITIASKVFTVAAGLPLSVGTFVVATADADITKWMHGQITGYSGTSLTVNVGRISGSGTLAAWTLRLSGPVGPSGAGTGDMLAANNLSDLSNIATARSNLGLADVTSIAALRALPVTMVRIFVQGYYALGDGGGGTYIWNAANSAADNGGSVIKPDSVSGAGRWILADFSAANALTFGAKTDGTNAAAEINAYMAAAAALGIIGSGYVPVRGLGLQYAVSGPITVGSRVVMRDFSLLALASGTWGAANGMVSIAGATNFHAEDVFCDANRQSGVNCWYITSTVDIRLLFITGCRWTGAGSGVFQDGGKADLVEPNLRQWFSGDAEAIVPASRSGACLKTAGTADWTVFGGNVAVALDPLSMDATSHHIRFIGTHFFNGITGVVYAGARNGTIAGWALQFIGCYFDTGYFSLVVSASTANGPSPDIEVIGCVGLYNAAVATYASWFIATTSVVASNIDSLRLANNRFTGGIPIITFAVTGAGTWGTVPTAALAAITSDLNISAKGVTSYPLIQGAGIGVTSGFLWDNNSKGTDYAFTAADSGKIFYFNNAATPRTMTIPNSLPVGWNVKLFPSGSGVITLAVTAGAKIGNSASNRTLTQYGECELICVHNSDGASAVLASLGTIT